MARIAANIRRQCEPPTDNCPTTEAAYRVGALGFFEQRISKDYADIVLPHPTLHAAAVVAGDGCILLPGESGSGKSTLAALLIRRGMRYISDELVCVEAGAQPRTRDHLSKALSIKPRSFEFFSGTTPCASFANAGEERRYFDPEDLRAGSVAADPAPIVLIIFPRFVAGSALTLKPLTQGEVVLGLRGSTVKTGVDLDCLLGLSQRATGYELRYGNTGEACDCVIELAGAKELAAV
jgi:hypothetical protein